MKITKIIFAVVMVLTLSVAYISNLQSTAATNAPTVNKKTYDAGQEWYTGWSAIDSATTYETEYFDMSTIDGQLQGAALTVTYSYTTPGNTSDTLTLTLQGRDGNDVVHSLGTALLFGSTTGTASLTTLSVTRSLAFCNFKVSNTSQNTPNRDCTGLTISGYFPEVDDIPPQGKIDY